MSFFSQEMEDHMDIRVDGRIFKDFPGVLIGILEVKGAENHGQSPAKLLEMTTATALKIRTQYEPDTLARHPRIDAWRTAYAAFGVKQREARSSVESLYRSVLNGRDLRHINKIVDIYNYISLLHMLPAGAEDLDCVRGCIELTYATENEPPVLLLGDVEARPPLPGEIIYKDGIAAICRRWNWREADRTKITEDTKNCVVVIEALPPAGRDDLNRALSDLSDLLKEICGAEVCQEIH